MSLVRKNKQPEETKLSKDEWKQISMLECSSRPASLLVISDDIFAVGCESGDILIMERDHLSTSTCSYVCKQTFTGAYCLDIISFHFT